MKWREYLKTQNEKGIIPKEWEAKIITIVNKAILDYKNKLKEDVNKTDLTYFIKSKIIKIIES